MTLGLLDKVAVLGRPGFWLGITAGLLLFALVVPFSARQLYWLLESERILEETADPMIVDFVAYAEAPVPRDVWEAGQTLYIQREVCIWKLVPGQIEREIVDTARLPLDVIPLGTILYLDAAHYDASGKRKPPPWCGRRIVPATIPGFMAPGPAVLRSRAIAALNPAKPHVLIPLRPVRLTINTTPTRTALRESREALEHLRQEMERKVRLLTLKLDVAAEDRRRDRLDIERLDATYRKLYQFLQAEKVIPPTPPPKGGAR